MRIYRLTSVWHRFKFGSAFVLLCLMAAAVAQSPEQKREIPLPSSKALSVPAPGTPQRTNSFPTVVALSPDGRYLATLNNGRGSVESGFRRSIAILDLSSNQLRDFPDARLAAYARQTCFLGLAWGSDGSHLYASIASLTDPEGKAIKDGKPLGGIGNGVAVYRFRDGALTPDRFLKLPLVTLEAGQQFTYHPKNVARGQAIHTLRGWPS